MSRSTIYIERQREILKKVMDLFLDTGKDCSIATVINEHLDGDEKEVILDIAEEIKNGVALSSNNELSWTDDRSRYEKLYIRIFGLNSDSIIAYPEDLIDSFKEVIMELNESEIEVVRKRFGLDGLRPMTLEELGNDAGKSRERIRQIEAKALRRLRNPSKAKRLEYGIREYYKILAEKQAEKDLDAECRRKEHIRLMQELNRNHEEIIEKLDNSEISVKAIKNELHVGIDEMGLSVRSITCLRRKGLYYADDFFMMKKEDLMNIRAFGIACYKDVERALNKLAEKKFGMGIEAIRDICS